MSMRAFDAQVGNLQAAIRACREQYLFIPALMLLYAAIDGMAWCVRQNVTGDVTEEDFEKWVETCVFERPLELVT